MPSKPHTNHGPNLPEAALYLPDPNNADYRDVVLPIGNPHPDGTVTAYSAREGHKIRVPLTELRPLPEVEMQEGEPTDWWRITSKDGQTIAQVHAGDYTAARRAAEAIPAARAASRRDGGLFYRRLCSTELPNAGL
ncbi:hypothetical protein ACIQU6_27940 [Streptomyces sp. NPDC090442]|uniref:hypothetical protein n=1 Tax=Streptomyces sp. NPDC090442 TaxID=3365962 RepID=UPI0038046895